MGVIIILKKSLFKKCTIITFLMGSMILGIISTTIYANEKDSTNEDFYRDSVIMSEGERASYNISYSFGANLKGKARSFSAGTIKATLKTTCSGSSTSEFNGELWRKNTVGESYISRQTFHLNGSRTRSWGGLNAGNYFIGFVKANDGSIAKGSGTFSN